MSCNVKVFSGPAHTHTYHLAWEREARKASEHLTLMKLYMQETWIMECNIALLTATRLKFNRPMLRERKG